MRARFGVALLLMIGLGAQVIDVRAGENPPRAVIAQKWEYKIIGRVRTVNAVGNYTLSDWKIYDDGRAMSGDTDIIALITRLGEAGWELVSVLPRASFATQNAPIAGVTTEEIYFFKRAK